MKDLFALALLAGTAGASVAASAASPPSTSNYNLERPTLPTTRPAPPTNLTMPPNRLGATGTPPMRDLRPAPPTSSALPSHPAALPASPSFTERPIGSVGGVDARLGAPSSSNGGSRPSIGGGMIGPQQGQGPYPTTPTNPLQAAPSQVPGLIGTVPIK